MFVLGGRGIVIWLFVNVGGLLYIFYNLIGDLVYNLIGDLVYLC